MVKMKKIIRFRGFEITKKELIADVIFLIIALIISLLILFIFDIHWSFYPENFGKLKFIGIGKNVYIIGSLIGTIAGFLIIKLFLLGVKEDEK